MSSLICVNVSRVLHARLPVDYLTQRGAVVRHSSDGAGRPAEVPHHRINVHSISAFADYAWTALRSATGGGARHACARRLSSLAVARARVEGQTHDAAGLVSEGLGVGDGLGVGGAGDGGLDAGSAGDGDGVLGVVATGVVGGGGEVDVESEDVGSGDGVGVVVGTVVGAGGGVVGAGDGAVVADGGTGDVDDVGVGVGASAATCAASFPAAAGGAAGGWAPSGTVGRPPLPLVPGGTGPGADGIGMTPVRYARAHCNTMST